MSDESQLEIRPKDDNSPTSLSKRSSGLVARGRRDAAMLIAPAGAEDEQDRAFPDWAEVCDCFEGLPTEEVRAHAEHGDAKQQYVLAVRCWRTRDLAESANWFRKAADRGYAPAQLELGWAYDKYKLPRCREDYTQAAKWYRKAADQGYAPAQFNLGVMYDKGEGVAQDSAEAARWYRMAADQDFALAQFNLGLKYDKGQGVTRDYAEAVKWYRKAADQGRAPAQFNLGLKYDKGQGLLQDYVHAHMWIILAAGDRANTNDDERKRFAAMRDIVAAKINPAQIADAQWLAAQWYRKKADEGNWLEQFNLGLMYEQGEGVAQNYTEASRWYRKAADQRFGEAQFRLGLLYESGLGVIQDYAEALMWFNLAVENYYPIELIEYDANLDRIFAKMNPTQIAKAKRLAQEWTVR